MAPKDVEKQREQQQHRRQLAQRRSWASTIGSVAKRIVDPFGLFTAPRREPPPARDKATPAAAGAADEAPPDAAVAAVHALADIVDDNDSGAGGGGAAAGDDASEDLYGGADVEMDTALAAAAEESSGGGCATRKVARLSPMPRPGRHQPLGGGRLVSGSSSQHTAYPMDIYEDDSAYELQADVPGMRERDLAVEVVGQHRLVVEGSAEVLEREARPPSTPEVELPQATVAGRPPRALRTERRRCRHFKRTFRLPHGVDHSAVTASIEDGVLIVRVAKLKGRSTIDSGCGGSGTGGAASERRRIPVDRLPSAVVDPRVAATAVASAAAVPAAATAPLQSPPSPAGAGDAAEATPVSMDLSSATGTQPLFLPKASAAQISYSRVYGVGVLGVGPGGVGEIRGVGSPRLPPQPNTPRQKQL